jgi:rRNA maturation endonuclease Nob1
MDWKSKWTCKCKAIWTSMSEDQPHEVCPICSGTLTRMPDKPLLTNAWIRRLGPSA